MLVMTIAMLDIGTAGVKAASHRRDERMEKREAGENGEERRA